MANKQTPPQSVSVTFVTPEANREKVKAFAEMLGLTRKKSNSTSNEQEGDLSKGINILLDYALKHLDGVHEERSQKIVEEMSKKF